MTAVPGRLSTPLDDVREHVDRVFGANVAKRLDKFKDGTLYISAGGWARVASWFVDFVVFVLGMAIGFVVLVIALPEPSDNMLVVAVLCLVFGVPMLSGLYFGNGRALGAVLTGTRLVRVKNGGRLGATAWWAMIMRNVLLVPFFVPVIIVALFENATSVISFHRISIDDGATRRLHAAGFQHLGGATPHASTR
ncbi:RDD family protein [Prauserella cavernicola]|uniref:RDD family protein n=1 Tax=Prauserella cavernicola TaxID=2800127 RepID=A0A934V7H1_9PSEU|nr:RDD family protein [Prauserella cavernicola]MBK1787240.1 RDD family protein [Prauserella cavernicola]